jgi:outer membrane protein assembly factor BamB
MTGDIIKGSVTLDPDGDPLLYFGSRDDKLRIVALDRKRPVELWSLHANFVPGIWNNDWDSSPSVHNDILYEGGENGYLFAFRLHRDYDERGLVKVAPEPLLAFRGWTQELLRFTGDKNVSIENSVAIHDARLYFANSAGRVVGLDISGIQSGRAPVVFDFWAGDDVDASIVVDEEGMLYVAVELERYLPRSDELGQLIKLDPFRPDDPVIWSVSFPAALDDWRGGVWSTPALADEVLYVTTHSGMLVVVDREDGKVLSTDDLGPHAWSSPVVVDESLLLATCTGELRHYSLADPRKPVPVWSVHIPTKACIESTPAVWKGRIIVGARDGYLYAFGN